MISWDMSWKNSIFYHRMRKQKGRKALDAWIMEQHPEIQRSVSFLTDQFPLYVIYLFLMLTCKLALRHRLKCYFYTVSPAIDQLTTVGWVQSYEKAQKFVGFVFALFSRSQNINSCMRHATFFFYSSCTAFSLIVTITSPVLTVSLQPWQCSPKRAQ